MAPISGTSFSSPAVAAVFSQVLTVLKVKNLVPSDPSKKISLLKRIILASGKWSKMTGESLPTANAYLAVLIAKHLQESETDLSIDDLISLEKGERLSICSKHTQLCTEIDSCREKKSCLKLNRKNVSLQKVSERDDH